MVQENLIRSFEKPDETREFPYGKFEIVHVAGIRLGRATYQPGWKWSVHNAPKAGTALCHVPHTGLVVSGHGVVQYDDGRKVDLTPGTIFHITSTPHDSWVEGTEAYVSLHVLPASAS